MLVDTLVAYFVPLQLALSVGIMLVVNAYSTLLYYGHERIWSRISWGFSFLEKKTIDE